MSDPRGVFGAHAREYMHSAPHARGASLTRLVQLLEPQASWRGLDVATGAGHAAFALAPHVANVIATDPTPEMLAAAAELAVERGIDNVALEAAAAENLPFETETFDVVTCRIAAHHFESIPAFLGEAKRVLTSRGRLAVVDNVVPDGSAGDYVNAFEKLRDPSHRRCLTVSEWRRALADAGFSPLHEETLRKPIVFEDWAKRHDPDTQAFLRAMLDSAPDGAAEHFAFEQRGSETVFHLTEIVLIAAVSGGP